MWRREGRLAHAPEAVYSYSHSDVCVCMRAWAWEWAWAWAWACVCVCACVRACVCACVRAHNCMCVCPPPPPSPPPGAMSTWPALKRWQDPAYLMAVAGEQVPLMAVALARPGLPHGCSR